MKNISYPAEEKINREGSQYCDMEQVPCEFEAYPIGENSLANNYETLSDVISDLENQIGVKLYPESAINYWKHRAEKAEAENALNEKLLKDEHNKLLDALDKNKKIKNVLSEMWKECAGACSAQLSAQRCTIEAVAERLGVELPKNTTATLFKTNKNEIENDTKFTI